MDIFNYVFLLGYSDMTIAVSCPVGMLEELRKNGSWPRTLGKPPPKPEISFEGFHFDQFQMYFWPENLDTPSTNPSSTLTTTMKPTTTTIKTTTTTTKAPITSSSAPRTTTTLKTLSVGVWPIYLLKYTKDEMPFIIRILYWSSFLKSSKLENIRQLIMWILYLIILILTRRRNVESIGTRFFAFHYTGFAFFQTSLYLFIRLPYDFYWRKNWLENAQCAEIYSTGKITFISDPYEILYMNRFGFFLSSTWTYFSKFLPILMTAQLVFHRINIYLAFAYPIWFKETVTPKLLQILYITLDITIILVVSTLYCLSYHTYSMLYLFGQICDGIFIFITLSHLSITILSVKVVLKYRKTKKDKLQEIKSFLWFSVLPVTSGFLVMVFLIVTGRNNFFSLLVTYTQAAFLNGSIHTYTAILREILIFITNFVPPLTFFICIPAYRKALTKILLFWRKRNQIVPIAPLQTIKSGELSLASNFVNQQQNQINRSN